MKVKSIRGTVKYDGIAYEEGQVFEINEIHFSQMQENIEIVSQDESKEIIQDEIKEETEINYSKLNKSKLLELAKQKGIEVSNEDTKEKIISKLEGTDE